MRRIIFFCCSPFVLATLLLTVKYYGLHLYIFQNPNPIDWLTVAVPSILLFTIPVELFFRNESKKRNAYLILNVILSAAMVSVFIYFKQFGIIVTYHAFMQAHQVVDVTDSILDLLQPLYLLYFLDVIGLLLLRMMKKGLYAGLKFNLRALGVAWGLSFGVLGILGMAYGGLLNELKQAERMGLVSYQAHTLFSGIASARAAASPQPITPDSVRAVKNIELKEQPVGFGLAKDRNLIVVQLESFQNFLIGLNLEGREITPVLNGLMKDSYYFRNVYQSIGQGNTSDAEFIMNTGFYPPAQQAASQAYGGKILPSLPRLLDQSGYTSITLHTNEVKFWNRVQLYPALGFDKYYDKEYFGDDDIIAFGPSDEVLYRRTLPILNSLRHQEKPFYAHVIAQSSHHPFQPPESKTMISLPEAWEGTDIGNYLKLANYADRALGQFISDLKEEGLWEQSMIVIYGDHFGISPHSLAPDELALLEGLLGHEYDARTVHNIPFMIAIPGVTDGGSEFHQLGGQVDMMATIANLLGISLRGHVQFGQDLLNTSDNILGSRFYLPKGSFYNDEIMYVSGETFGEGTVIPLKASDPILEADPMLYKDDFVRIMRLLQMNDAYLELLPNRY